MKMDHKETEIQQSQEEITRKGNPRRPQGMEGALMLRRMNESHRAVTEWALDFFDFREGERLLDIGCGGGATLKRMSERLQSGRLTGVDYSAVSVEESRRLNEADIRCGKMEIVGVSVEKLPFADCSFDKIITVESFYFWPEPAENLKEVRRVLKMGGTFLLVADIYRKEGLGSEAVQNIERYQLFNPSIGEFQTLFENAGFSEILIHTKAGEDWICIEGRK